MTQQINYSNELSGKIALVTGGRANYLTGTNFVIDGGMAPTI